jgi:hypothetical protein
MYQVHRLLSVDSLLEILHNNWVTKRIHGLGWLIGARQAHTGDNWTI